MGTGVPGEGSGRAVSEYAPFLLDVFSCDRVFSTSEVRRRLEDVFSRKTCRWSRRGEEASGRWGKDMVCGCGMRLRGTRPARLGARNRLAVAVKIR